MCIKKWLTSLMVSGTVTACPSWAQTPVRADRDTSQPIVRVADGARTQGGPAIVSPSDIATAPTTWLSVTSKSAGDVVPVSWPLRRQPEPKCLPPAPATTSPAPKKDGEVLPKDGNPPAAGPDQLAGATEAGTQPGAQFNPYMFGDRFGIGRGTASGRVGSLVGQAFLTNNGANNTVVNLGSTASTFNVPITNSVIAAAVGGNPNLTFPQRFPAVATSGPISTTAITTVTGTQAQAILFQIPGTSFTGGGLPLQNNATFQQYIDSVFKSQFGSGRTVFTGASLSAGEGTTGVPADSPDAAYQFNFAPDSQVYYAYDYIAAIAVPLPSSGGVVGTTKISENNSPMPRDRVIFVYDYFSNVPLTAGGFNVSRFSPGFEKTFFNGRASLELQIPFASTVDPTSMADGLTNRATVFGNVNMTLKSLFYSSKEFNLSGGIGVALPTGPDTRVTMADGSDLVRIENKTVLLSPFIAGLYTPNERFYTQAWATMSFDASGSPVFINPNLTGLGGAGRIYDQTVLQLDWQAGYWLVRDTTGNSFLTGLAPFVELHYNTPINDATIATAGSFSVGSSSNRFDELNIATGLNAVLNNRINVVAGVVLPLGNGDGKFFDAQFGVRMNWLFGARDGRSAFASGF